MSNDETESGLTIGEVAETGEDLTTEYNFTCECEHVDYSDQLETLILNTEYIANTNAQIISINLFSISLFCAVGISVILYKFFKIFF